MNATAPQHTPKLHRRLGFLLILAMVAIIGIFWIAARSKPTEDERNARLQSAVATARIAQRDWEEAREANRTVPGCVRRGELRRLQLLSERADLDWEDVRTEEHDQESLEARRAAIDLELAQLEIEWAKITSSLPEAQRLQPARQSAIRTICRFQGMGPEAKDAVPALVAALGESALESYARSALERIDPAAL